MLYRSLIAVSLLALLVPTLAYADDDKRKYEEKRDGRQHEIKWERDGCKYEYKRDGHKVEEKYDCDDDDRKKRKYKNKHKHRHDARYHYPAQPMYLAPPPAGLPYGLARGTCDRELLGQILGGAVGGLAGTQIGKGSGNTAAIIGGALVGLLVGGEAGRSLDRIDQRCVGTVLEYAPDAHPIVWQSPGAEYRMVPLQSFENQGRYCREYRTQMVVGGRPAQGYGTACRQPDGDWEIVSTR